MQNSICLPVANFCNEVDTPPRCFICFKTHDREVRPYRFNFETISEINEVLECDRKDGLTKSQWWATLFFPAEWPPARIRDFLTPRKPSIDSGIHLPVVPLVDAEFVQTTEFLLIGEDWRKLTAQPFTGHTLWNMTAARHREDVEGTKFEQWCVTLFFPEEWPPALISEYINSPAWQGSLFGV